MASSGMKPNVGTADRVLRALVGIAMLVCSVVLPLSIIARAAVFGGMGVYLVLTSLVGSCLGYRLLRRSTCPVERRT
jgi:hypothetical protein